MSVYTNNTEAFSQYLQSMVRLEELQKMTEDLDKELEDSQRLMLEIKTIYNGIPNPQNNGPPPNPVLNREHIAQFLDADAPRLLMSDMQPAIVFNIDNMLAIIKSYAEDLKKKIIQPELEKQEQSNSDRVIENNLNLDQYAASLDQLAKRLDNIKQNRNEGDNKNPELEAKFTQLFDDVRNFTQMIETKTKLSEANKTPNQLDHASLLVYDNLIDKLLKSINEATNLLKNQN